MYVPRVLVTPTRVVRLPAEPELSNRVVRHFKRVADQFLRVTFGDENGARLGHANQEDASLEDVYGRWDT